MKKRTLLVIALTVPLLGFWGKETLRKGQPPTILDAYAPSKVQPGHTWKVFLHARDNDGDMKDITAMLLEPGNVISPVSFIRLKDGKNCGEFQGYLYLKTPKEASFLGKEFFIRVQVRDRELNRSKAIKLPLAFANVPTEDIPEKWQNAANHQLGGIVIDLGRLNDWRSIY